MPKDLISKLVQLPSDHWEVLEQEASLSNLTVDAKLTHAVRLMQLDEINTRKGLRRVYVNSCGQIEREPSKIMERTASLEDLLWDSQEVMSLNAELGLTMDQLVSLVKALRPVI